MLKSILKPLVFVGLFCSFGSSATLVWLNNISIRRVVHTTNGDFIYIDVQSGASPLGTGGSCVSAIPGAGSFATIYVPGAAENVKDHFISGILAAFATKKPIKLAGVVTGATPTYGITGIGSTSCYLDYLDLEN
jgi:hypothetical protein